MFLPQLEDNEVCFYLPAASGVWPGALSMLSVPGLWRRPHEPEQVSSSPFPRKLTTTYFKRKQQLLFSHLWISSKAQVATCSPVDVHSKCYFKPNLRFQVTFGQTESLRLTNSCQRFPMFVLTKQFCSLCHVIWVTINVCSDWLIPVGLNPGVRHVKNKYQSDLFLLFTTNLK